MKKNIVRTMVAVIACLALLSGLTGCNQNRNRGKESQISSEKRNEFSVKNFIKNKGKKDNKAPKKDNLIENPIENSRNSAGEIQPIKDTLVHNSKVEKFKPVKDNGQAYVAINDNTPFFDKDILDQINKLDPNVFFAEYGENDNGRCTSCVALLTKDSMPTKERESLQAFKPLGWKQAKYPGVIEMQGYLYNRCHLIGYQLTGENINPRNLITGTRYLNVEGMLPFENMVADLVKSGSKVLYRVTPIYEGNNEVASGVLMEGKSLNDDSVEFCVYCYNKQPGVIIDYSDGSSQLAK